VTGHEWFVEHRIEYACRTLDDLDAKRFEKHLPGCEECRREVAQIEADLEWLPMGLPPVPPDAALNRRIVERALRGQRVRPPAWRLPAAIAAAALLVAGGWFLGRSRTDPLRQELAALRDTLSIMRQANRILQASVEVDGSKGGLMIFADEVTHRWNVVVHGLPPAPEGRRYQFWFICAQSADSMVRGTEVPVDTLRPTIFATDMPEQEACRSVIGAALTEEPATDTQGPPRGRPLAHLML
jgi:hypothetical protein